MVVGNGRETYNGKPLPSEDLALQQITCDRFM